MYFKGNSLFIKVMLTFFVLILPLSALSVWFTNNSSGQMREEIERSNESVLLFYYNNLRFELARMNSLLSEYSVDSELADLGTMAPIMSNYEIDRRLIDIWIKLRQMKSSSPYIEDVRYYSPSLNKTVSVLDGISVSMPKEWQDLVQNSGKLNGLIMKYKDNLYLMKSSPEGSNTSTPPRFLLTIQLSAKELTNQLASLKKEEEGGAYLTFGNKDQTMITSGIPVDELPKPNIEEEIDSVQKVIRTESSLGYYYSISDSSYPFRLVSYITKDVLHKPIRNYSSWMWGFMIISCFLVIIFTYRIYLLIHQPLITLVKSFRTVEQGNLSVQITHRSGEEFEYLYSQFNHMQEHLQTLIEDNYIQRIRTQDAELKHLQSQITPHFLYNSLFTIKQMAELELTDDIKMFSDYLGRYFRFMTRDFKMDVPLGDEMEHSVVFLQIQEMRFSHRMLIEWNPLPNDFRSLLVPRIIIQPLLENVFKHGLADKASKGYLHMWNRIEGHTFVIVIEDNGDGLSDEQLIKLQELLARVTSSNSEGETTGLMNVHQRLLIRFGAEYGLHLSRSSLGGLKVELKLPCHSNVKE